MTTIALAIIRRTIAKGKRNHIFFLNNVKRMTNIDITKREILLLSQSWNGDIYVYWK